MCLQESEVDFIMILAAQREAVLEETHGFLKEEVCV
jgi:hypothetical protein